MKRKRQKKWYGFGEHTMYLLSLLFLFFIAVTASCGGGGGGGDGAGDGGVGPPPPPPPLTGRAAHSQVWTGTEMIVWGGTPDGTNLLNTGGRYDPATDTWTATSTTNAPSARFLARASWVSAINKWIVWGGTPDGNTGLNTGGVYDPAADSWSATSATGAPSARFFHRIVRSGSNVIVWGGTDGTNVFNTGGVYDPVNDTWIAKPNLNAGTGAPTARYRHHAVRRGGPPETMIVWGGTADGTSGLNTGGIYNAGNNTWTAKPNLNAGTGAPSARFIHTAVETGTEMIVWGGTPDDATGLNTGGVYDIAADSWTLTTTTNAPSLRFWHRSVWTGTEMIVWGGTPDYASALNTGGRYNPATDSWTPTNTVGAP